MKKSFTIILFICVILSFNFNVDNFVLSGELLSGGVVKLPYSTVADAEKDGWTFFWGDEFDGEQIDQSKWVYDTGGTINNEAQIYTDRKENARLENGKLIIEARKEKYTALDGRISDYTSACLTTCKIERGKWNPLVDIKYGRIEIRAKLPTGRGVWPALWFLELPAEPKDSWQRCGEIDMMEYVGYFPDAIHANLHNWDENAENKRHSFGNYITKEKPYEDFHIYWMEWTPDLVEIYYDAKRIVSYCPDPEKPERFPYNKPYYFLMNLAIGGSWGGVKGIDDSIFPCRFEVDFVRIYQKGKFTVARVNPNDNITPTQTNIYQTSSAAKTTKGGIATFKLVLRGEKQVNNLKVEAGNLQKVIVKQSKNLRQGRENLQLEKAATNEVIKPDKVFSNSTSGIESICPNEIAANTNQTLLIDYKIPREISTGIYAATIIISGKVGDEDFRYEKPITADVGEANVP